MKILGISGSPRKEDASGVIKLVKTVLVNTNINYELVSFGVGGTNGQAPADEIEKFFSYNLIETVAKITGQGAASCYSCGYGETCKVGIPSLLNVKWINNKPESIPDVSKQTDVMQSAVQAGKLLSKRLTQGHNRIETAQKIKQQMFKMLQSSI